MFYIIHHHAYDTGNSNSLLWKTGIYLSHVANTMLIQGARTSAAKVSAQLSQNSLALALKGLMKYQAKDWCAQFAIL